MALTKAYLQEKYGEDLKSISTLNLDQQDLESCFRVLLIEMGTTLNILSLNSNSLSLIDIQLGFTHLRKLDLSSNRLTWLGSTDLWRSMPQLQILYLHDNLLESWGCLESISTLPQIMHLTVFNNPLVHLPNYHDFTIHHLKTLLALDFRICTEEERRGYKVPNTAKVWIQKTPSLDVLRELLYRLRRKWEASSPSIRIQSNWRRYWVRKNMHRLMTDKDIYALKLQRVIRSWLLRRKLNRDLEHMIRYDGKEHLLYSPSDYIKYKAVLKIEAFAKERFLPRKARFEKRTKAAIAIQKEWKRWTHQLQSPSFLDSQKLYILKSQLRTLICMLKALSKESDEYHPANTIQDRMAPEFFQSLKRPSDGPDFAELYGRIMDCSSVKLIRIPEVDNLVFSKVPYFMFTAWIRFTKMANNALDMKEKSVVSMYRYQEHLPLLSKFKNRGSTMTPDERKKLKNLKLVVDDYLELIELKSPSIRFNKEFFKLAYRYNLNVHKQELPVFIPLFGKLVDRVRAAGVIQASWRSYKEKQNVIYQAVLRRTAYCIQRWWRFIPVYRRLKFLTVLKGILKSIRSPVLYMQEHIFQALQESEPSVLRLPEQEFKYYASSKGLFVAPKGRFVPKWVGARFRIDYSEGSIEEKTLQAVVLSGGKIDIVNLHEEVRVPKVANPKLQFVKVEYSSIEEARCRAAVIFLKTLEHSSNSYLEFFTLSMMENPFLMSKLRQIWRSRRIDPKSSTQALGILNKALKPVIEAHLPIIQHSITPPDTPIVDEEVKAPSFSSDSPDEDETERTTITQEKRKRVSEIKEISRKRHELIENSLEIQKEHQRALFREEKERFVVLRNSMYERDIKEKTLKWRMAQSQKHKRKSMESEKEFVNKFVQARNMLQKLNTISDINRWKAKQSFDMKNRVDEIKKKSKVRRELVQSIIYEKFKDKQKRALV